jgi:hypothetical protein
MSNDLAVLDAGLPSYLKELELDDVTKSLMGGGGSSKRISIRGSVFRMLVNGKEVAKNEDRSMNVVIVNAAPTTSRTYYSKAWSEDGDVVSPECWSADGTVPDAKAANPQSKRCVDCPMNVKGSGQNESRACRYSQRLAVVLANDIGGDVMQLTLPAASLFGDGAPGKWPLQTYAKMVGSKGIPVTALVTEMRFDTDSSTPRLTFSPVRVLDKAEALLAIEQGKSPAAQSAIMVSVAEADKVTRKPEPPAKPETEAKPEPKAEQKKAKPVSKAEAEPKVEPEPEAEPTVRGAKKDEAAPPKKDLSAILAEWDDA